MPRSDSWGLQNRIPACHVPPRVASGIQRWRSSRRRLEKSYRLFSGPCLAPSGSAGPCRPRTLAQRQATPLPAAAPRRQARCRILLAPPCTGSRGDRWEADVRGGGGPRSPGGGAPKMHINIPRPDICKACAGAHKAHTCGWVRGAGTPHPPATPRATRDAARAAAGPKSPSSGRTSGAPYHKGSWKRRGLVAPPRPPVRSADGHAAAAPRRQHAPSAALRPTMRAGPRRTVRPPLLRPHAAARSAY